MVLQYTCMCTVYKICILYMYLIYANVIPNDSVWRMFNPKTEGQPIKIDVDRILDMVLMFYIHLEPNWPLFSGVHLQFLRVESFKIRVIWVLGIYSYYIHMNHTTLISFQWINVQECARQGRTERMMHIAVTSLPSGLSWLRNRVWCWVEYYRLNIAFVNRCRSVIILDFVEDFGSLSCILVSEGAKRWGRNKLVFQRSCFSSLTFSNMSKRFWLGPLCWSKCPYSKMIHTHVHQQV